MLSFPFPRSLSAGSIRIQPGLTLDTRPGTLNNPWRAPEHIIQNLNVIITCVSIYKKNYVVYYLIRKKNGETAWMRYSKYRERMILDIPKSQPRQAF